MRVDCQVRSEGLLCLNVKVHIATTVSLGDRPPQKHGLRNQSQIDGIFQSFAAGWSFR
jgi:hypothetical protein